MAAWLHRDGGESGDRIALIAREARTVAEQQGWLPRRHRHATRSTSPTPRRTAARASTRSPAGCRTPPTTTCATPASPSDGAWVVRRTRLEVDALPALRRAGRARRRGAAASAGCGPSGARRGPGVEATAIWVHVDPATGRPRPLGADAARGLAAVAPGDRRVKARLRHPDPPADARPRTPWHFRRADLDVAGHVNNAAYLAVARGALGRRARRARSRSSTAAPRSPGPARRARRRRPPVGLRAGRRRPRVDSLTYDEPTADEHTLTLTCSTRTGCSPTRSS